MVKQTNSEDKVASSAVLDKPEPKKQETASNPSLEEWVNSIVVSNEDEDKIDNPQGTINLSRFGLKDAQDVIQFLKSPAGEATISEISAEIARSEKRKEQQRLDQQEHDLLMHRLRALLFLWFIEEESQASEKLRELSEQNEKLLKSLEKSSSSKQKSKSDFGEVREYFDRAINRLTEKQNENTALTESLTEQLEKLKLVEQNIVRKFTAYRTGLEQQESSIHDPFSPEDIESNITSLSVRIDGMTNRIGSLLEEGNDGDARELLHQQNALNLQIGVLHDMRAVRNSEKYYADSEGNEVDSFKKAHFILKKGANSEQHQRIIKHDNKLYLLKPGQDWNTVKESNQEREKARIDYKVLKQDLMSVKRLVQHHEKYELNVQKTQVSDVEKRLDAARKEKLLIGNQMKLVQAAMASAEHAAQQANLKAPPVATPVPTAAPIAYQASTTRYKKELQALRDSKKEITPQDLFELARHAPKAREATEYLKKEFESYARRGNIPQNMMRNYLQNLERFGVDTTKPNVSNIKQPLDNNDKQSTPSTTP